jgi:hypothetical protein
MLQFRLNSNSGWQVHYKLRTASVLELRTASVLQVSVVTQNISKF